jgi:hypothetical protein
MLFKLKNITTRSFEIFNTIEAEAKLIFFKNNLIKMLISIKSIFSFVTNK